MKLTMIDRVGQQDALQEAWQKLSEHCFSHGLRDVLMAVRQGYADELSSERRARKDLVRKAVAAERERCAAVCDKRGSKFHAESPFSAECHGLATEIRNLLEAE